MTKLDAGLMTSLPASDPGNAAVWGSKRINPRPQSCLCLAWSGCPSNDDDDDNCILTNQNDKMTKVKPMTELLCQEFKKIPMQQELYTDEQLVSFKGGSQLKQCISSKPHKWGYKIFLLADTKEIIHDFISYTGKIQPVEDSNFPDLKPSAKVILHLSQSSVYPYYLRVLRSFPPQESRKSAIY